MKSGNIVTAGVPGKWTFGLIDPEAPIANEIAQVGVRDITSAAGYIEQLLERFV